MFLTNRTDLLTERLGALFERHTSPFDHSQIDVRVRYSRGADFSGSCYYGKSRLHINLGAHLRYPYVLGTHVARADSNRTHWWRDIYRLAIADAYQLALFIYLHELYHYLVKRAGRGSRYKEAMCDRFAARILVDEHGCALTTSRGEPAARASWDFQDLHAFVAQAPRAAAATFAARRNIPVRILGGS